MSLLNLLPMLITSIGLYFLIKLRFFFIIHPIAVFKRLFNAFRDKSSRKSLALALAGTLGVGNIVGVAYGISVGGAGSIFWILVSSIFAAVIKYAESTLAADKRSDGCGGMSYVIKSSFKRLGYPLATVYAILCLLLSLTMGSALKSQSAIGAAEEIVKFNPYILSVFFVIITLAVVLGGAKKIENATAIIIPLSTIVYVAICLAVVFTNLSRLPAALSEIINGAFNFKSFGGGVSSFLVITAMKEGYARGLLSNEAGAGTSSMAQARSENSPSEIGLLGICEVLFDTVLLCTLTGITVLVSGVDTTGRSGIVIVSNAISGALGKGSGFLLFLLVFAFAYSTVVCWYYYGSECLKFITGKHRSCIFTLLFVFSVFVGFLVPSSLLINVTDYILFFMTLLTLATLTKNSERIVSLSEQIY